MHASNATSRILNILGKIYQEMGSDSIALNYFHLGMSYSLSHNFNTAAIQTYNSLAKYFYDKQNMDSSMIYIRKSVELIQRSGVLLDEPEAYSILANLYKVKRNFDSTVKYMQLMQTAKDSLLGKDKIEQMQFIVFDEDRQKKEQQATALAYQNKMKFYSLIGGLALLIIVAGFLWRSTLIRQKSYVQLKKQQAETDFQRKTAENTLKKLQSTQSQLIQSEKMASLGELTAGIAHEIQNPLNFVNNFSEVNRELSDELEDEIDKGNLQQVKAIARNIKENEKKINHHGRRAETIVKGMLQHSRETKGQKEPTDINALADEYLRLSYQGLRARDKSFSATLRTDFDDSIGKINIIPQDLGRVLLNLYNNAFYALSAKALAKAGSSYEPTVSVSTKKIDGKVEIKVKDNGMGIPQKALDKIFQPFFTTKPAGQGTGLGLSLCYDIIKAHEGEIKVETKEGEYAEFIILLPVD
jgi:two-component system, NtrC family, sensor kinase